MNPPLHSGHADIFCVHTITTREDAGRQCILYIFPIMHRLLDSGLNRQRILYIDDGPRQPMRRFFELKPTALLAVVIRLNVSHALAAQRTMLV